MLQEYCSSTKVVLQWDVLALRSVVVYPVGGTGSFFIHTCSYTATEETQRQGSGFTESQLFPQLNTSKAAGPAVSSWLLIRLLGLIPRRCSTLLFLLRLCPAPGRPLRKTRNTTEHVMSTSTHPEPGFSSTARTVHTEHGLQFDQAAGEVVEVDDLVVGVSSDQHLVQLVVEFEP